MFLVAPIQPEAFTDGSSAPRTQQPVSQIQLATSHIAVQLTRHETLRLIYLLKSLR